MHVIVIGGGIGGLCLAHGLRSAGVSVEVHERDRAPGSRWEGYRIHVNPAGSRSLHACLPPHLWEAFVATAGRGGDFGFLTDQLEQLLVVEESIMYPGRAAGPHEDHYAVDRRTLRRLLLAELDDVVRIGAEFVRFERPADGRVAAIFADGERAVGDLLVGADGAASRVRRQYLPQAGLVDAGVCGLAAKIFLTDEVRSWLPRRLQTGMNAIMVDGPISLFTSVFEPPRGARSALAAVTGVEAEPIEPYVLCALVVDPALLPADVTTLDPPALRHLVDGLLAHWHPDLRRMLTEAELDSRNAIRFTASAQLPYWESTNVTLLGDAAHTMPPMGGLGGNAAMRDARLLSGLLGAVQRGERDLLDAVREYERDMCEHGYASVRDALATRDQMLSKGAFAARAWFRLCQAVPALRRRTFTEWEAPARPRRWERAA
jgi:2-polyprenyl-6-methoxyphenol hydroxylase-like FAD-dependent oxidoreductase